MATSTRLETNAIIPPGEFLKEELEARGTTQKQLAAQMGRPVQMVSELCRGKRELTPKTALDLERVLGIAAYIWLGLETDFRLKLERRRLAGA